MKFGLLGAGDQALEIEDFAAADEVAFRISSKDIKGEALRFSEETGRPAHEFYDIHVVAAVGAPGLKRALIEAWPGEKYHTVIAIDAHVSSLAIVRAGCVIAPQSVIMRDVSVASHVLVNIGATISHGTQIGEFSTISPGVNIGGNCTIGAGVFVGIGATISHGIKVADGCVIGAGAVVIRDLELPGTYVGVPAKQIGLSDNWLTSLS